MGHSTFHPLVTVSATYGTGGSAIAPRLAEVLRLPFIDRFISADLPHMAHAVRSEEGLAEGEQESTPAGRFLSYFARAASVGAMMAPDPMIDDDETIRSRSEEPLKGVAAGASGVVLGRAAAVVLASRPRAYHIRLDAPVQRRIEWATGFEGLNKDGASKRMNETDKARTAFVKRLYRVDPADPGLYHIVLDSTVLGVERSVTLLADAARSFFEAHPE